MCDSIPLHSCHHFGRVDYPNGEQTSVSCCICNNVNLQNKRENLRLWKIQRKISKAFGLLEYYTSNQWDFNNEQALEARKLMNETERNIYRVEVQNLDLEEYIYNSIHGARLYVLKEGDETLPTARRHMKM